MSASSNVLGEFLRARRATVRPEEVGLPASGQRRVPGLRRAEVALLAGISPDYYLRLEQGRDRNPSPQVLQALAGVFGLDTTGVQHLLSLADTPVVTPRVDAHTVSVPPSVITLLGVLNMPAFVQDRFFDVLAVNPLATALSPRMRVGENRLLSVFLDPDERALFPDWGDTTARMLAGFRRSVGAHTSDARFGPMVDLLTENSEQFRKLWARQDVQPRQNWPVIMKHPQLGLLTLNREMLLVLDSPERMVLMIFYPDPGSDSVAKIAALGVDGDTPAGRSGQGDHARQLSAEAPASATAASSLQ